VERYEKESESACLPWFDNTCLVQIQERPGVYSTRLVWFYNHSLECIDLVWMKDLVESAPEKT
jgi:hypothetical protein